MKIVDIMTSGVELTSPDSSVHEAARKMADLDVGSLPVGDNDKLIGMITDRDIAIRAVAEGKDIKSCKVRDVMTDKVLYRFEDDDVEALSGDMASLQVRRMPIVDRQKRLVGIVSVGDIAVRCDTAKGGHTLRAVASP